MSFYHEALDYFTSHIEESSVKEEPSMRELKVDREFLSSLVKYVKGASDKDQDKDLTSHDQKLNDELLSDPALLDKLNEALKDVKDLSDLNDYLAEDPSRTDPKQLDESNKDYDDLSNRFDKLKDILSEYLDTADKRVELEKRLDKLENDKSSLEKSLRQSKSDQEKDLLEKVLSDVTKDIEYLKSAKDLLERYSEDVLERFKDASYNFADQAKELRDKYDDLINQMKSDQDKSQDKSSQDKPSSSQKGKDQKGRDQKDARDNASHPSMDRSTDSASFDSSSDPDRSDTDSSDDSEAGDQKPKTPDNSRNNRSPSQDRDSSMKRPDKSKGDKDLNQVLKELADALAKDSSGQDSQDGQDGQQGQDGPDGDGLSGDGSGRGRDGKRPGREQRQGQGQGQRSGQSKSPYKTLKDILSKGRKSSNNNGGNGQEGDNNGTQSQDGSNSDGSSQTPGKTPGRSNNNAPKKSSAGAAPSGSPSGKSQSTVDPSLHKHNYPRRDFSGSDKDPFQDASGMGGFISGSSDPGTDFKPSALLKLLPRQDYIAAASGLRPEPGKLDPNILLATKTYLEALFRSVIKSEYDPVKIKGRFVPVEREVDGHKVKDYARGAYRIQEDFDLNHMHWMLDVSSSMNYTLVDHIVDIYIRSLKSILKSTSQPTFDVIYHSGFLAAPKGAIPMKVLKVLGTLSRKLREGATSSPAAITDGTNGSEVVMLRYWKSLLANKMGLSSKLNAPVFWITDLYWNLPSNFDKTLSRLPILLFLFGHDVAGDAEYPGYGSGGAGIVGNMNNSDESAESSNRRKISEAFGFNHPNSKLLLQKMNIVIFVVSDLDRSNAVRLKSIGIGKAVPPAITKALQAALRGKVQFMVSK